MDSPLIEKRRPRRHGCFRRQAAVSGQSRCERRPRDDRPALRTPRASRAWRRVPCLARIRELPLQPIAGSRCSDALLARCETAVINGAETCVRLGACTRSQRGRRDSMVPEAARSIPAPGEKCPDTTAATVSWYTVRPVPSLISASPSRIVEMRSGAPRRRRTDVAAIGSVGPRIAPSTSAGPHPMPASE
jgi:hypothetical protein